MLENRLKVFELSVMEGVDSFRARKFSSLLPKFLYAASMAILFLEKVAKDPIRFPHTVPEMCFLKENNLQPYVVLCDGREVGEY